MRPRDHIILGSAATVGLYFLHDAGAIQNVIFFWFASILIDIDHYLDYIYNTRFSDYSFTKMMAYHELLYKRRFDPAFINVSIFHSVECMAVLLIAASLTGSTALLFVWWGFLFHIVCDTIKLIYDGKPSVRCNTVVGYFFKVKRFKAQGLDTKAIYRSAAMKVNGNYANQ